jgi:hypothetical protein
LIQFVDEALEALLRLAVPLPEPVADISFAAPDKTWGASVTRPTVNVFLWHIRRNQVLSSTGLGQRYSDGEHALRRPTDPVVDLRYLVTAWASDERDEHQLLGSVLRCVLANASLPTGVLSGPLAEAPFVKLALAGDEARATGEFWTSLDGRLKPGLQVVVTLPVAVFEWLPAGPPASAVSLAAKPFRSSPTPGSEGGKVATGNVLGAGQEPLRRRRSGGVLTMEGRRRASQEDLARER